MVWKIALKTAKFVMTFAYRSGSFFFYGSCQRKWLIPPLTTWTVTMCEISSGLLKGQNCENFFHSFHPFRLAIKDLKFLWSYLTHFRDIVRLRHRSVVGEYAKWAKCFRRMRLKSRAIAYRLSELSICCIFLFMQKL